MSLSVGVDGATPVSLSVGVDRIQPGARDVEAAATFYERVFYQRVFGPRRVRMSGADGMPFARLDAGGVRSRGSCHTVVTAERMHITASAAMG